MVKGTKFENGLQKTPVNPFVPNAPFLYPLNTSENRKVFSCFQGVEKGYIGNEWVQWIKWEHCDFNSCLKKGRNLFYLTCRDLYPYFYIKRESFLIYEFKIARS